MDDGSTDGSPEVVAAIGDPRVTVLRQAPAGASRARTLGTRHCRGEFVQYLDADDVLLPGTLAARVGVLQEHCADVAYSDWIRYERGPDGVFRDAAILAPQLGPRPDVELLRGAVWWPPGALLYRRALVERVGPWREDLPVIQDARFQLDAILLGARFAHVPGVGVRYRVRGAESLSRRDPRAFLRDCLRSAADLQDLWERDAGCDPERRRALLDVYAQVARGAWPIDRTLFQEAYDRLRALDPHYLPSGPFALRLLSRVLGYPQAERVAVAWRVLKRVARWPARGSRARVGCRDAADGADGAARLRPRRSPV